MIIVEKKKNCHILQKKDTKRVTSEILRKTANQMQCNIIVETLISTFTDLPYMVKVIKDLDVILDNLLGVYK